ncbi:hypothetical protein Y032_0121g977 [Ancylostoma ceylanicum]|uniref:Uncharacterized protein n=1 Tax=Ancylostoma ceylanicum TaxID=53326 RepID=A0A016TAH4_9BILA|nr:hypothetical protein Y032_0121g977 [Ancylostoma ceylanicum]
MTQGPALMERHHCLALLSGTHHNPALLVTAAGMENVVLEFPSARLDSHYQASRLPVARTILARTTTNV